MYYICKSLKHQGALSLLSVCGITYIFIYSQKYVMHSNARLTFNIILPWRFFGKKVRCISTVVVQTGSFALYFFYS